MIFVTGGTGLVGIRLLFDLLSMGKEVIVLKRKTSDLSYVEKGFTFYGNKKLFSNIEWVNGDILDENTLAELLTGVTQVFHSAAMISFNPSDRKKLFATNVLGTRNMINACLANNIDKFCHVSSVATLGDTTDGREIDENAPRNFEKNWSDYSTTKFQAELEVWRGAEEGLKVVIVNPSVILGAGDPSKSSNRIWDSIAKGLKYYTKGMTGYVDVGDVSRAMITLMDSKIENERFVVSSENLNYRHVFNWMAEAMHVRAPNFLVKPWMTEIVWRIGMLKKYFFFSDPLISRVMAHKIHDERRYSAQKLKQALKFKFIPIEESIKTFAGFYAR